MHREHQAAKQKANQMISPEASIHSLAAVDTGAHIGSRSRIWQFCVVLPDAVIGEDCNICAHCLIEGGVTVGSRVTVKSGVQLWDGVTLEDDVFVGPNVTFTNDHFPRSRQRPEKFARTVVRSGASIGANATILPGITIGRRTMIGAGSVVTRDIPDNALFVGNPARFRAWLCGCAEKLSFADPGIASCKCGRQFRKLDEMTILEIFP